MTSCRVNICVIGSVVALLTACVYAQPSLPPAEFTLTPRWQRSFGENRVAISTDGGDALYVLQPVNETALFLLRVDAATGHAEWNVSVHNVTWPKTTYGEVSVAGGGRVFVSVAQWSNTTAPLLIAFNVTTGARLWVHEDEIDSYYKDLMVAAVLSADCRFVFAGFGHNFRMFNASDGTVLQSIAPAGDRYGYAVIQTLASVRDDFVIITSTVANPFFIVDRHMSYTRLDWTVDRGNVTLKVTWKLLVPWTIDDLTIIPASMSEALHHIIIGNGKNLSAVNISNGAVVFNFADAYGLLPQHTAFVENRLVISGFLSLVGFSVGSQGASLEWKDDFNFASFYPEAKSSRSHVRFPTQQDERRFTRPRGVIASHLLAKNGASPGSV
jgi:outer membrane protein assembly factor BamB